MISNADNFKKNRNRVIESHVRKIMRYVIDCYHLILKDGKKYDYATRGKIGSVPKLVFKQKCFVV